MTFSDGLNENKNHFSAGHGRRLGVITYTFSPGQSRSFGHTQFEMSPVSELSLRIHHGIKKVRHVCTAFWLVLAIPILIIVFVCAKRISKRYSILIALVQVLSHS